MSHRLSDLIQSLKISGNLNQGQIVAKGSSCNIQFNHNTDMIPITSLNYMLCVMMLSVPSRKD